VIDGASTPEARKGSYRTGEDLFNAALAATPRPCEDAGTPRLTTRKTLKQKGNSMLTTTRRAFVLGCLLVTSMTSPAVRADDAALVFSGKVPGGTVTLTREEIAKLPQRTLTEQPTSFPAPIAFTGPSLAEVLTLAGAAGGDITLTAADDYSVEITADEMKAFDPILAIEKDGALMAPDDFGPFFVMWPFKDKPEIDNETFQAKAIWSVVKIEVK
jgi:hypothetical protein